MRKTSYKKLITLFLLILLIALRSPIADIVINISNISDLTVAPSLLEKIKSSQDFTYFFWDKLSFLMALSIIIINRANLIEMNIDKSFVIILSISIGIHAFKFFYPFGWAVLILSLMFCLLYKRESFAINNTTPITLSVIGSILFIYLLLILWYEYKYTNYNFLVHSEFYSSIINASFTVTEELIFRGFLWMQLKKLNWHESIIVVFQAILFWLFHIYQLPLNPLSFWIFTPLISLFLGIVTAHSKSLSPSTLAHFLYNSI